MQKRNDTLRPPVERGARDLPLPASGSGAGSRGNTILEVVIATATFAIALAGVYGVILSSVRTFSLTESLMDVQQTARFVVERVSEEARWADGAVSDRLCSGGLCPDRVILHIPAENPLRPGREYQVQYLYDSRAHTLVRRVDGQDEVMAQPVDVVLRYFTSSGEPAADNDAVARIQMLVTARPSQAGRVRDQRVVADVLLRNLQPQPAEADLAASNEPAGGGGAWRPSPRGEEVSPARMKSVPNTPSDTGHPR